MTGTGGHGRAGCRRGHARDPRARRFTEIMIGRGARWSQKSHLVLHRRTSNWFWPRPRRSLQIRGVRWLGLARRCSPRSAVAAAPSRATQRSSASGCRLQAMPALGLHGRQRHARQRPAKDAGLQHRRHHRSRSTASRVAELRSAVLGVCRRSRARRPAIRSRIDVRRGSTAATLKVDARRRAPRSCTAASSASRSARPTLVDVDDPRTHSISTTLRGKTTVVGWFDADRCVGCSARVRSRCATASRKRLAATRAACCSR